MAKKIVLHIEDRDLADTLVRVIADDPLLRRCEVSSSETEATFEQQWVYVIDAKALTCPRIREMAHWKHPHVVLMVHAGDRSAYSKAWDLNIHKVVDESLPPDIMRLALVSEVREVA